MKKAGISLLIIFGVLVGFLLAGFLTVKNLTSPVSSAENAVNTKIEVPYGATTYSIANKLQEEGIIKNARLFYYSATKPQILKFFYSDELPQNFVLKSGTYTVNSSMNNCELMTLLSSGQTEYVKVSIPEGLTITKIAAILEEKRVCSAQAFIDECNDSSLAKKYNIPFHSVEGYLFPETYYLNIGMDASQVACIMLDTFYEKIRQVPGLAEKSAGDLNDIVILASIVQREYQIDSEAPLIASVFKNRLRRTIGLYSCATVEYIITEIEGRPHPERILISDTRIDSPYNTYLYAGLPPGPISNPGVISLDASTNTPKTQYYFFRVVDADAGRHVFSKDFDEHVQNNNLYTKKISGK